MTMIVTIKMNKILVAMRIKNDKRNLSLNLNRSLIKRKKMSTMTRFKKIILYQI